MSFKRRESRHKSLLGTKQKRRSMVEDAMLSRTMRDGAARSFVKGLLPEHKNSEGMLCPVWVYGRNLNTYKRWKPQYENMVRYNMIKEILMLSDELERYLIDKLITKVKKHITMFYASFGKHELWSDQFQVYYNYFIIYNERIYIFIEKIYNEHGEEIIPSNAEEEAAYDHMKLELKKYIHGTFNAYYPEVKYSNQHKRILREANSKIRRDVSETDLNWYLDRQAQNRVLICLCCPKELRYIETKVFGSYYDGKKYQHQITPTHIHNKKVYILNYIYKFICKYKISLNHVVGIICTYYEVGCTRGFKRSYDDFSYC